MLIASANCLPICGHQKQYTLPPPAALSVHANPPFCFPPHLAFSWAALEAPWLPPIHKAGQSGHNLCSESLSTPTRLRRAVQKLLTCRQWMLGALCPLPGRDLVPHSHIACPPAIPVKEHVTSASFPPHPRNGCAEHPQHAI